MPPDLAAHVAARLHAQGAEGPVVVGVSGGLDSTVLFDALVRAGVPVVGVHVHHGLRGVDADADAAHAEALCAAQGVPFVLHRALDAPATGRQAWGRALRHRAFADAAHAHGAAWVATGHHANDQAETVLLALLRGTGVRGLSGMAEARRLSPGVHLVRPLLALPRAVLHAYAEAHGLAWREDASNADVHYRRASLRHDLLPRLDALVPGAAMRIARTAAFVRAERTLAAPERHRFVRDHLEATPDGGRLHTAALMDLPAPIRTELILEAARRFLPGLPPTARTAARLDALLYRPVGRRLHHPAGTVYRTRAGLAFVRPAVPWSGTKLVPGETVEVPGGRMTLDAVPVPKSFPSDVNAAYFDADVLALPLTLRRWRAGDRIHPFGFAGTRRVSDVLTDARIEPDVRARACVALDANGVLVAVLGVRAGHEAPITGATQQVLCLRFAPTADP